MTSDGFVGADPRALTGLAETAEQYSLRVRGVVRSIAPALAGRADAQEQVNHVLAGVAWSLDVAADELRWRAEAIAAAQRVTLTPILGEHLFVRDRAEFAALAVFDIWSREDAYRKWRTLPDAEQLAAMQPAAVRNAFAGMAPSLAQAYAYQNPRFVSTLDGAPPPLRYLANRLLICARIETLRKEIARIEAHVGRSGIGVLTVTASFPWHSSAGLSGTVIRHLEAQINEYQRWLDEGRQILLFDPSGDGRVVEVFGDIEQAEHIGVVVPGMSNDLSNFSTAEGGFRANASQLRFACQILGEPDVATVAWLGYDTPDNLGAVAAGAARNGAPSLVRMLEGIDPTEEKHVTVVAHSYGSVLAGVAADEGLAADDIVFVGSPGTTLDEAADAELRPGGRVWAALAEGDPIGAGLSTDELLPPAWVPLPLAPTWIAFDMLDGGAEELWHGTNPVAEEFGAQRITTDGSSGHSEYFEKGSLLNLARIVLGFYTEVELAE